MTATTTITTLTNAELDLSKIQNQAQMLSSDSKGATEGKTTVNPDTLRQSATEMAGTTYTAHATDEAVTADGIYTVNGASIDADGIAVTAAPAEMIGKTVTLDGDQLTRLIGATEADGIAKADGIYTAKVTDFYDSSSSNGTAVTVDGIYTAKETDSITQKFDKTVTSSGELGLFGSSSSNGSVVTAAPAEMIGKTLTLDENQLTRLIGASETTAIPERKFAANATDEAVTADGKFTGKSLTFSTVTQRGWDALSTDAKGCNCDTANVYTSTATESTWKTTDVDALKAATVSWIQCNNDFAGVTALTGETATDITTLCTANFDANMLTGLY